jgi:uncharacterized protein YjiK
MSVLDKSKIKMTAEMKRLIVTILLVIFIVPCCEGGEKGNKLKILAEYNLKIPEPSDLSLSADGKNLWTVSDKNGCVYLISLEGKVKKKYSLDTEDLEGITVLNDSSLAVVSEKNREVIFINNYGKEYFRKKLPFNGADNRGPEGIAFDSKTKNIIIVKEDNPRVIIRYDAKFNEINRTGIDFLKDLSGIDFVDQTNEIWLVSDESKSVTKCSSDGELKEKYSIPIKQAEGIAVDYQNKKIYLVSDSEEKLYVVEMK